MIMLFFAIISSYLLGSIPTAYIFGKVTKGIDIREHGSGNVGATNVFRVLGKIPGIIVLVCDILKGFLAVAVAGDLFGCEAVYERIILAITVVAGHNWTVFLQFKGGKGIAASLGVLIALTVKIPSVLPVLCVVLGVWIISFLVSRIVSLSSIIASVFLPTTMAVTHQPFSLVCLGVLFCLFIVFRHRPNIKRLLAGQEPRVPFSFLKK